MDVSQALSALPALRSHAEGCEGLLTDRLALSTSSSCDSITIGVAAVVNGTAVSLAAAQSNARARACRANKHLETQCDDMDGVVKILESMVRHFEIKGVCCEEWPSVQDSMLNAGEILRSLDALPLSSSTITVREIRKDVVVRKVQGMSRFHLGVDVTRSRVHVPPLLQRGDVAGVSVTCLDGCGDTVLGLSPSDVAQRFVVSKACGEKARGWAVVKGGVSVRGNVVSLSIAMAIDCVGTALLQLVIGGARFPIPLQVACSITGAPVRSLLFDSRPCNRCVVISPSGDVMAISNDKTACISVFSTASSVVPSQPLAVIGGDASVLFSCMFKMCFSPLTGNLLVADCDDLSVKRSIVRCGFRHKRTPFPQEITLAGEHVRTMNARQSAGFVHEAVMSIACSGGSVAVGFSGPRKQVLVMDAATGEHVRLFGSWGSAPGDLSGNSRIRFTPDGRHILVAEDDNNRLSLFTLSGDFVRCVGVGVLNGPTDVDFAVNGDIIVADSRNDRIAVFTPDGAALVRTFGSRGTGPREFECPFALAMHRGQLFVLNASGAVGRVQVFY